jgi:hypothetical protein
VNEERQSMTEAGDQKPIRDLNDSHIRNFYRSRIEKAILFV